MAAPDLDRFVRRVDPRCRSPRPLRLARLKGLDRRKRRWVARKVRLDWVKMYRRLAVACLELCDEVDVAKTFSHSGRRVDVSMGG